MVLRNLWKGFVGLGGVLTFYNLLRQEVFLTWPPLWSVIGDWPWWVWLILTLVIFAAPYILERLKKDDNAPKVSTQSSNQSGGVTIGQNYGPIHQVSQQASSSQPTPPIISVVSLTIQHWPYPWTKQEKYIVGEGIENRFKLAILFENGSKHRISDCGVKMRRFEYRGVHSIGGWVPVPDGIETKYLMWDEGYESKNGKLDIEANGGYAVMLLAVAQRYAPAFNIMLLNGEQGINRHLVGEYRMEIQISGQTSKDGIPRDIAINNRLVSYKYISRRFDNMRIEEIKNE